MENTSSSHSTSSDSCTSASESSSAAPVHVVNIREVKQKTLALLTELYRTETGDVKRMAMSLLQTLYTIEEQEQVTEMNTKIQKLMQLIEDQKREQAEMEEASLAASQDSSNNSADNYHYFIPRSRAHTEDSNQSSSDTKLTTSASKDDKDETDASKLKENTLIKRWHEKLESMRKTEPTKSEKDACPSSSSSQLPMQQWRESMSTRMDASRERLANGWKESTTKLQHGWKQRKIADVEAKPTEETLDDAGSVSTEGSSTPPSPNGSSTTTEEHPVDLLQVFRNVVKDGIDSKQSRESLEMAISVRKEKARNRWAETRAKWKWNAGAAADTTTTQE